MGRDISKNTLKKKGMKNNPMAISNSKWKKDYYSKSHRQMLKYEALNESAPTTVKYLTPEEIEQWRKLKTVRITSEEDDSTYINLS